MTYVGVPVGMWKITKRLHVSLAWFPVVPYKRFVAGILQVYDEGLWSDHRGMIVAAMWARRHPQLALVVAFVVAALDWAWDLALSLVPTPRWRSVRDPDGTVLRERVLGIWWLRVGLYLHWRPAPAPLVTVTEAFTDQPGAGRLALPAGALNTLSGYVDDPGRPAALERHKRLQLLEGAAGLNQKWLEQHPEAPRFQDAGVRLADTVVGDDPVPVSRCIETRVADAESLVIWRVAELRRHGELAKPYLYKLPGQLWWGIAVQRENGSLETPEGQPLVLGEGDGSTAAAAAPSPGNERDQPQHPDRRSDPDRGA